METSGVATPALAGCALVGGSCSTVQSGTGGVKSGGGRRWRSVGERNCHPGERQRLPLDPLGMTVPHPPPQCDHAGSASSVVVWVIRVWVPPALLTVKI